MDAQWQFATPLENFQIPPPPSCPQGPSPKGTLSPMYLDTMGNSALVFWGLGSSYLASCLAQFCNSPNVISRISIF